MEVVCISDTHNLHHKVQVPNGDVLIHAGDATMRGRYHEVENFLRWFDSQPHRLKIFVPGNHDFLFDKNTSAGSLASGQAKDLLKAFPRVTYLRDKEFVDPVSGFKFYGTPWVKGLEQWAFGWKSDAGREAEFSAIPPDTDVLITHGPAFGTLDFLYSMRLGDEVLAERIAQLNNLRLHVHGHIHYSHGINPPIGVPGGGLITVNAALCTEDYSCTNNPIVVKLKERCSFCGGKKRYWEQGPNAWAYCTQC